MYLQKCVIELWETRDSNDGHSQAHNRATEKMYSWMQGWHSVMYSMTWSSWYLLNNCRDKVVQFSEQSVKHEQICPLGEVICSLCWAASSVLLLSCIYWPQQEAAQLRGRLFAMGSRAVGLHRLSLWSSMALLLHGRNRYQLVGLLSFCIC